MSHLGSFWACLCSWGVYLELGDFNLPTNPKLQAQPWTESPFSSLPWYALPPVIYYFRVQAAVQCMLQMNVLLVSGQSGTTLNGPV